MPTIVIQNGVSDPPMSALATTLYTKSDGVYVVLEDGSITGPLGVGIGGIAGGSLTGTYPNPGIAVGAISASQLAAGSVTGAKIAGGTVTLANLDPTLSDPVAVSPGLRTLGVGSHQAAAGNDPRLSDSRPPIGSATGDLGGAYPGPTISKLQGYALDLSTPPTTNYVLTWNGTKWLALPAGAGSGIIQLTADVTAGPGTGSQAATVVAIQSHAVSAVAPTAGQALVWDGSAYTPTTVAGGTNTLLLSPPGAWLHSGLTVGTAVIPSSTPNTVVMASNVDQSTSTPFGGLIYAIPSPGTATIAYYGEFPWPGAPLTPGAKYYLGTAGDLTTTPPSAPGSVSLRVGYAKNSTTLILAPKEGFGL